MSLLEPHMLFHTIVQWLSLLTMVILVGGIGFEFLVFRHAVRAANLPSAQQGTISLQGQHYLKKLVGWSQVLLIAILGVDLLLRIQMMSGKPFGAVVGLVPSALIGTHIGKVWLGKMGVVLMMVILWSLLLRRPSVSVQHFKYSGLAFLMTAGLFCLMVSLSGHAADKGNVSIAVVADWLHVMAISTWVGGLVSLRIFLPRTLVQLEEKMALQLLTWVVARFSTVATVSVSTIAITGIYNTWLHIHSWEGFVASTYGLSLLAKLALVLPMIGLGGLGRYYTLPHLRSLIGEPHRNGLLSRLADSVVTLGCRVIGFGTAHNGLDGPFLNIRKRCMFFILMECILAVGVLACTAVLTQTMPPHVTSFPSSGETPMHDMPGMKME